MAVDFTSTTEGATQVVNGRTYTYTAGAWRAESAESAVAATITDGDTTHAPSGDAVFDALSNAGAGVLGVAGVAVADWEAFDKSARFLQSSGGATNAPDTSAQRAIWMPASNANNGALFCVTNLSDAYVRGYGGGTWGVYAKLWTDKGSNTPASDNAHDIGSAAKRVRQVHGGLFYSGGIQVVGARVTGWSAPTGTATKTAFATSTVTLPQLAERVKALTDALIAHGLIGT